MLNIQKYLLSGKSYEDLFNEHGINVTRSTKYPELIHLKYDQIESYKKNPAAPIVKECRGLILNEKNNFEVVAYPFNRFFNFGESYADVIDWNSARITEKLDGSLCYLWYYAGVWNVSTSGSPDASGNVGKEEFTFSELFWKVWDQFHYQKNYLNPYATYMFELMTPYNEVVVRHKENNLILIGVRLNYDSYEEFDASSDAHSSRFKTVKTYKELDSSKVLENVSKLNPIESEGVVVVDKNFNRIKIKNADYVKLHKLRSSFNLRSIIELIQAGEQSELISYYPDLKEKFDFIEKTINDWACAIDESYELLYQYSKISRKDYAYQAAKSAHSAALFGILDGKFKNGLDYFMKMNSKKLEEIITCVQK